MTCALHRTPCKLRYACNGAVFFSLMTVHDPHRDLSQWSSFFDEFLSQTLRRPTTARAVETKNETLTHPLNLPTEFLVDCYVSDNYPEDWS